MVIKSAPVAHYPPAEEHPINMSLSIDLQTADGWAKKGIVCHECNGPILKGEWCYGWYTADAPDTQIVSHYICIAKHPDNMPLSNSSPEELPLFELGPERIRDDMKMASSGSAYVVPKASKPKRHEKVTLKFKPIITDLRRAGKLLERWWPGYSGGPPGVPHVSFASEDEQDDANQKAYDLWGLPVLRLPQQAAEFYLLEFMVGVHEYEPARAAYEEKIAFLADAFAKYFNMAVGGELRHMSRFIHSWAAVSGPEKDFFPTLTEKEPLKQVPRSRAWLGWHRLYKKHGATAIDKARQIFSNEYDIQWEGGFGGGLWARIAETLHLFLIGKLRPKLFVDRVWSIQHNGGTALDKAPGMFRGIGYLSKVLNAQARSKVSDLYIHCGPKVRKLFDQFSQSDTRG